MALPALVVPALLEMGANLISRLFPDPAEAAKANLELLKMQQSGELATLAAETDLAKGQLAVNAAEAANASMFVAGWRPAIGWCCALGLAYEFLLRPMLPWLIEVAFQTTVPDLPELPSETLMTLLFGMLGLGSLRTIEKVKGRA
jgi:hypothetical protein